MAQSLARNSHRWIRCALPSIALLVGSSVSAQEPSSPVLASASSSKEHTKADQPLAPAVPGAMIFIDPETGELTSEPAPGQLQRLLAQGRALARQRSDQTSNEPGEQNGSSVRRASAEEILRHTAPTFVTPFGIGVALDDRFLHGLRTSTSEAGETVTSCGNLPHQHPTEMHPSTRSELPAEPELNLTPPVGNQ